MGKTINDVLKAMVAGETPEEDDVRRLMLRVDDFEISVGTQPWDLCPQADLGAYVDALADLRARAKAMREQAAPAPVVSAARLDALGRAADLEFDAQEAEDREDYAMAGSLRARARALRVQ